MDGVQDVTLRDEPGSIQGQRVSAASMRHSTNLNAELSSPFAQEFQQQELGRILKRILRDDAATPDLMDAIGRLKTTAFSRGLTDRIIEAELQVYSIERRP